MKISKTKKNADIPIAKPFLNEKEVEAVTKVINSGWIMQGNKIAEFEKKFANYVGAKEAIAVSSGTAAIQLALLASGCSVGDSVICPSYSFIATANAIKLCGSTPIFVDIDNNNYNLNPKLIESKILPSTKAILVVHQVGFPANLDKIRRIAEKYQLSIIEDAACAIGSEYKNEKIGKPHSVAACFSFHPRKILTTGDGGMITTRSAEFALKVRRLRQHGIVAGDKEYMEIGFNFRLTDIQAAIGIEQLKKLNSLLKKRREQANKYIKAFKGNKWLTPQEEEKNTKSNFQAFQLRIKKGAPITRDEMLNALNAKGIKAQPGIKPIHLEKIYKDSNDSNLLETERASQEVIMLPIYHTLEKDEQQFIIETLLSIIN